MSEVADLVNYYTNLLIMQYHDKTNAKATIAAVSEQLLGDLILKQIRDAFDINTAEGVQLDMIGKYVGINRIYNNEELLDGDMRWLIKIKIAQNLSDHTLYSINNYLATLLGTADIAVSDNKDMTLTYLYPLYFDPTMQLALDYDLLPRPLGVAIILSPAITENGAFGYSFNGTESALVNGYGYNEVGEEYEGGSYFRQN